MDLTTQTPAEIDTAMVEAMLVLDTAVTRCYAFEPKAVAKPYWYLDERTITETAEQIEKAIAARVIIDAVMVEFERRGGWERYIIVPDGHVHYGRITCPSLDHGIRPTERRFIPSLSAMTEAQMVEAVGETACTVCFPTAPAMPAFQAGLKRTADEKAAVKLAKLNERRARLEKAVTTKAKTLAKVQAKGEDSEWERRALGSAEYELLMFDRKYPGLVASPAA